MVAQNDGGDTAEDDHGGNRDDDGGKLLEAGNQKPVESAAQSSENELKALSAERDIEDLYKVIYMQKAVGEVFDAIIGSVTPFGLFCELENTCEGLIPLECLGEGYTYNEEALTLSRGKHSYKLGQQLRVRVTEANVLRRRIYMELAEESGRSRR